MRIHTEAYREQCQPGRVGTFFVPTKHGSIGANGGHKQHAHPTGLTALSRELNAISPLQTLGRGYSITQITASGEILRSSDQVQAGDKISTRLANGELVSIVDKP